MLFQVSVPWWVLAALVGGVGLIAYWAYAHPPVPLSRPQRVPLMVLRFAGLLLLILFLLRPVGPALSPAADTLVPILIDVSRSMSVTDVNGARRIDHAARLVRDELVPRLVPDFQIEVLAFGTDLVPADVTTLEADAPLSDLTGALSAVSDQYRGRSVAGIVIVSDGGDTGSQDVRQVLTHGSIPVYPVAVGSARLHHDLEVTDLTVASPTMSSSVVDVEVGVVAYGHGEGPVEVRLTEDGRLLNVRRIRLPGDGVPVLTVFQVSPKRDAATMYTVQVPANHGEEITENNTRSVIVAPPGNPRRVLMVEGSPGYDHSFLKRVWLADSGVSLDAVVRKGQNDRGEHTFYIQADPERMAALATGYPIAEEALYAYDMVVLANIEAEFLRPDQLAMTAAFVAERGGGLLLFGKTSLTSRGLVGSPLEELLPLELSDRSESLGGIGTSVLANKVALTEDGAAHPVMRVAPTESENRQRWANVPVLTSSVAMGAPRPGASVLALVGPSGGEMGPLIAVQRYGRGRTMVFTGEAAWRWQMQLPANDRMYESLWGQAVRWLVAAAPKPVTLTPSGRNPSPGEVVYLDVDVVDDAHLPVFDASPVIHLTGPDGDATTLNVRLTDGVSGPYTAQFSPERPGVYRIEVEVEHEEAFPDTVSDWLLVGGVNTEFVDPRLNEEVLRRVATASGGRMIGPGELDELPELLRARLFTGGVPGAPRDLWHGVWSFVIVLMILATEWILRRTWGMR